MDPKLIEKFIEVTGESEAKATQYLTLADGNLENAIMLMFDSGNSVPVEPRSANDEPEVRAPILPTQEVLVPSEVACAFPRPSSHVFDHFRDFAVETRRQEEEMSRKVLGTSRKLSARIHSRRLEDLFRPPCDILFVGTFHEAREHAKSMNRWLLVNIQDQQEFACQVLNRDVWPDQQIREIINDHFVLWQALNYSGNGKRYIDFYKVHCYPYVAIIDPRTGECMRSYNQITVDSLVFSLNDMLSTHASPDNMSHETEITRPIESVSSFTEIESPSNSNYSMSKRSHEMEKKNGNSSSSFECIDTKPSTSVTSTINQVSNIVSKRSRIDELNQKDQQLQKESQETNRASDGPSLRLCLRLPNGSKHNMSMLAADTIELYKKDGRYGLRFDRAHISGTIPEDEYRGALTKAASVRNDPVSVKHSVYHENLVRSAKDILVKHLTGARYVRLKV